MSSKEISQENIEELFAKVINLKKNVERQELENFWMQKFFSREAPQVLENVEKVFSQDLILNIRPAKLFSNAQQFCNDLEYSKVSKAYRIFSRRITSTHNSSYMSVSTRLSQFMTVAVNVSFNIELCEQIIEQLKEEILKERKETLEEMKAMHAKIEELKIDSEELKNAKNEFTKVVIDQGIDEATGFISPRVFTKFLRDLSKNGAIIVESIRLKNGTLRNQLKKLKRVIKKHEELSSCLYPVDFELAELEKKKFEKMTEEKMSHYFGLKNESRDAALIKSKNHKKFLQSTTELKTLQLKVNNCEQSITKLRKEVQKCEEEIQQIKKSIKELSEKIQKFNAPTILEYIEKCNDFDLKKSKLKKVKRQEEIAKIKLQNLKIKYREQIEINKNYP